MHKLPYSARLGKFIETAVNPQKINPLKNLLQFVPKLWKSDDIIKNLDTIGYNLRVFVYADENFFDQVSLIFIFGNSLHQSLTGKVMKCFITHFFEIMICADRIKQTEFSHIVILSILSDNYLTCFRTELWPILYNFFSFLSKDYHDNFTLFSHL